MTFALKTEIGFSSCGGLLVRPIIGRFCGYWTSGRSPFSNGSAAVAANARNEGDVNPAPSAAMAAPECFMRLRRLIIAFLPFRLVAAHDDPGSALKLQPSAPVRPYPRSPENRQPTSRGTIGSQRISFPVTLLQV